MRPTMARGGFPGYVELVVCIEMMSDSRVHQAEERATNAKSKHHEREKEHDDETAAEGRRLEKALEVGLGRAAARSLGRHENSDSCNHKSLSARRGWSRKRV